MKKQSVLNDHVKRGNTFYPPLLASESLNIKELEWRRKIVPELIWLVPLVQVYDVEKATSLARALTCAVVEESGRDVIHGVGFMSCFLTLTSIQQSAVRRRMLAAGTLHDLCNALEPLLRLYPKCPLRFLMGGNKLTTKKCNAIDYIRPLLEDFLFRREKLPTLVQGVFYDMLLKSGRMHVAQGIEIVNTNDLVDYPDSDVSQKTASFIRCIIGSINVLGKSSWWPEYFWQQGQKLGKCQIPQGEEITPGYISQAFILYHLDCFNRYLDETTKMWYSIMTKYNFNIFDPLRDEILLGLATRIYRLTIQIASYIPNWVEDIGQVYVRMVVETYIYWKWLKTRGSDADFKKFYDHGLGQQKLYMEHINEYFKCHGINIHEAEEMNSGLDFLKRHRMPELVSVNIGNAFDKTLWKLAEEADLKELYSLVFSPTSSVVHGMYDSLERYYLRQCRNPFHCFHRVPFYWSKNTVSEYGIANAIILSDWTLSEMLEDARLPVPEVLPGDRFYNLLHDEQKLEEFMSIKDNFAEVRTAEQFINQKIAENRNNTRR